MKNVGGHTSGAMGFVGDVQYFTSEGVSLQAGGSKLQRDREDLLAAELIDRGD